jgi:U-box domain
MIHVGYTPSQSIYDDARALNIAVPDEFICPITRDVMMKPMMTKSGFNFERKAILEWIAKGNDGCPMTRTALSPSKIVPNKALEGRILKWMWEYCLTPSSMDDLDDDDDDDNEDAIVMFDYSHNDSTQLRRKVTQGRITRFVMSSMRRGS